MKSEIEVPDGWTVKKLEDMLLFLRNGLNAKQKNHGKYMITRIETISKGAIDCSRVKYVDGLSEDLVSKYRLIDGDILFSHINSTKHIGKTAIYNENNEIMIHGINLLLLRPNAKISSQFLLYILKKTKRDHLFERIAKKAVNQASINTSQLKKIQFLVPPLQEQQKIADILSKVDEQIDFTEKTIDKTEELKKGLMQKILTKGIGHAKFKKTELGEIPEKWEIVKFNKKLDVISGKGFKYAEYSEEGVKLLKIDNVSYNEITWDSVYYLPTDYIEKYPNLCLEENDILLALNRPITNDKLKIGMLERKDLPAILYQRVGKIVIKNDINRKFIYYLLSHILLPFIKQNNVGGNIPFINLSQLRNLKIILPPIEEQKQIASILSKVDEQIQDNKKELKHLQELKKGLMQDLLTGKVRVSV